MTTSISTPTPKPTERPAINKSFVKAFKAIRESVIPMTGKATFQDARKVVSYRSIEDIYAIIPDILMDNDIRFSVILLEHIFPKDIYEEVTPDGEVRTKALKRKYIGKFEGKLISTIDDSEISEIFYDCINFLDSFDNGHTAAYSCATRDWLRNKFGIASNDSRLQRGTPVAPEQKIPLSAPERTITLSAPDPKLLEEKQQLIADLKNKIQKAKDTVELESFNQEFFSTINKKRISLETNERNECGELYHAKLAALK